MVTRDWGDAFVNGRVSGLQDKTSSGDGWLHNNVNTLNTAELYSEKVVMMANFMFCVFYNYEFSKKD